MAVAGFHSIALVTFAAYPELTPDDRLLASALRRRGLEPVAALWDDPREAWGAHGLVVPRSCWDYHQRAAEFARWLDRLERDGARVVNPVPTLRWNMRKTYLRDLGARGVPVVETAWVARGAETTLRRIADERGWEEMVVKPVVSASAHETWRAARPALGELEARFAAELGERDLMVQPFLPGFTREGELSCILLAGRFSHAVRKRPRPGDFRVQEEHGGSVSPAVAPPDLVRLAAGALAAAPSPPVYARVDTVATDRGPLVTELELIEPALYFGMGEGAAETLAAALARILAGARA